MTAVSDERDEMFHQAISQIEKMSSGKGCPGMLADYCWSIKRERPPGENKRQKKRK
jgi:hypothetical protein